MITAANSNAHDSQRSDSEFPISRLYVHVTVFSPAREETVIVMQQVTEIYGGENGWDDSARHSGHQDSSGTGRSWKRGHLLLA